ncbi:hypothetical protein GCM10028807_42020 [Spirosoma daeguense]
MQSTLYKYLLWILLWAPFVARAQVPHYLKFRHFTTKDGLSSPRIIDFIQDRRGFLWISTESGINRFDGRQFLQYHLPARQPGGSIDNTYQKFAIDKQGQLWVLSQMGLSRYDITRNQFRLVPTPLDGHVSRDSHHILYDSSRTCLWLATSLGLLRYDLRTGKTSTTSIREMFRPFRIVLTKNDQVVIAASEGAFVYDPATNKNRFYPVDDDPQEHFFCAFADKDGTIWMGRNGRGLVEFDPTTGQAKHYFPPGYGFNQSFIAVHDICTVPAITGDSILWIATHNQGLRFFNRHSRKFVGDYVTKANLPEGLVSNQIDRLWLAPDGNLWLADQALGLLDPNDQAIQLETLNLSGIQLTCMIPQKEKPNHLWIGTLGWGVFDYDLDAGTVESMDSQNHKLRKLPERANPQKYPQKYMNGFCYDKQGRLWTATSGGVYVYKFGKQVKYFSLIFNGKSAWCTYINIDKDGIIWLAAEENLCRLNPETGQYSYSRLPSWPEQTDFPIPLAILPDDNTIWVGTTVGLFQIDQNTGNVVNRFRENTGGKSLHHNAVYCARKDRKGSLWLASYEGGAKRFWPQTGKMERIKDIDTRNIRPEWIDEDAFGYIWIQAQEGFYRYQPDRRKLEPFKNEISSFLHEQFAVPVKNEQGEWCAVQSGIYYTVLRPERVPIYYKIPKPLISEFSIFDKPQPFDPDSSHIRTLSLRYDQNVLKFTFTSPQFSRSAGLQFAYQLVGFDERRVLTDKDLSATYTNLDGGDYIFRVWSGNAQGLWNQYPAEFRIHVETPFWRAWWFYALCALIFVGVVYGVFRYREEERIRLRLIRDRIARDLHDDMGSYLSSISILSQTARRSLDRDPEKAQTTLDTIGETSRRVMDKMGDIVWSVNPEYDSLGQLAERLRNVVAALFQNTDVVCYVDIDEKLSGLILTPEHRRDLYFVSKEALTNVAKYARAKQVLVQFRQMNGQLQLTISDDGCGFDYPQLQLQNSLGGNGLKNMQTRAQQVNGTLLIESVLEKGTTITLLMKL